MKLQLGLQQGFNPKEERQTGDFYDIAIPHTNYYPRDHVRMNCQWKDNLQESRVLQQLIECKYDA